MPTPIIAGIPVARREGWSENENTMRFSAKRSGQVSRGRLMSRYRTADLVYAARTLCNYLSSRGNQDLLDQYRCAERALHPVHGSIGSSEESLVEALYYWVAANDTDPSMPYSVAERSECIVRGLYESQRGNNDFAATENANSEVINFRDNRRMPARRICSTGITNKLAEVLNRMHPDVVIFDDILGLIYDLIRGFIAQYLYASGATYDHLKSVDLDLSNKTLLPQIKITDIKAEIIEIFGMANSTTYMGFLTQTEINYIDNCLSDAGLGSLSYLSCESPTAIEALITDANTRLSESRRLAVIRTSVQPSTERSVSVDVNLLKATILSVLPDPHWSTYRSTDPSLDVIPTLRPATTSTARATSVSERLATLPASPTYTPTWTPSQRSFFFGVYTESDDIWRQRFNEQRRTTAELIATARHTQPYLTPLEATIVRKERAKIIGVRSRKT